MNPIKTILTVTATAALALPAAALADAPSTTKSPSSSKQCETLRTEMGADAFKAAYGTNKNKRNAFGKCVSGKSEKDAAEVRSDQGGAANDCRKERGEDEKAFSEKYGTNANRKNAFGKCVSKAAKAKAEDRNDDATEAEDNDSPQNDDNPGQSKKQSS